MKRNAIEAAGLLTSSGVITFDNEKSYTIKGTGVESPFRFGYQELIQPETVSQIATRIQKNVPPDVNVIAGTGFSSVIAYELAKLTGKEFVQLNPDARGKIKGFTSYDPLANKNVLGIIDILATGKNTAELLRLIREGEGQCIGILPILDMGFNLHSKECKDFPIWAFTNVDAIADLGRPEVTRWKEKNQNLFGSYNRYEPTSLPA